MTNTLRMPVILVLLFLLPGNGRNLAQSVQPLTAAELLLAMKKLTVVGSVLFVAAHPDDENTALLSYLARGRMVRAGYLSMTRGEGGQNLIGSEQGALLGILRTQELLAARRIDGAEQFFTRAIDFGYSKTSEETIRIWDRGQALSDVVWVIRTFRPDVIITRFSPTLGGHGNHTASAILAEEAFHAAGDPTRFPEQLQYVRPWKPKRLLFNVSRFLTEQFDTSRAIAVDLGEYNPILGRSYTEIAGMSRSMHKSQGFGAAQARGSSINYFIHTAGEPARRDLLEGVDLSWKRINGGEKIAALLEDALRRFNAESPSSVVPILLKALAGMRKISDEPIVRTKERELLEVIQGCLGFWIEANASDFSVTPGSDVRVTLSAVNRSPVAVRLEKISWPFEGKDTTISILLENNVPLQVSRTLVVPRTQQISQPYWLMQEPKDGMYRVENQSAIGAAENDPAARVAVQILVGGERLTLDVPVRYRWVDPVDGEMYRPLEIVPPVAMSVREQVLIVSGDSAKPLQVTVQAGRSGVSGTLRPLLPPGWKAQPDPVPFSLPRKNDEQLVRWTISPLRTEGKRKDGQAQVGTLTIQATVEGETWSHGIIRIRYPHILPQVYFPPARVRLVSVDLQRKGERVGYIMGSGDEIPPLLQQIGYAVTLLTEEDLAMGDLSRFDVIIAGVRVYNTRPEVRIHHKRLMEYVERGGTYIVQYVTVQRQEAENLGPYPFTVSRDRVSVEDAPVEFNDPLHPLLMQPNRITAKDFDGWVQERGLYFAEKWDERYQTILESHDPGEPPRKGALLYARYGKGHYIYTGLAFFRQLPAGVPGAYRLFVNMMSVGK